MFIDSRVRIDPTVMSGELTPPAHIKNEPMLYRADPLFARKHGGILTNRFLNDLANRWWPNLFFPDNLVIDSRVHMLMPGMYPCIPGWHHDDVPRTRSDGQPDYGSGKPKCEHAMAFWGDASKTEFALGGSHFAIPRLGKPVYKDLHEQVEFYCKHHGVVNGLHRFSAPERQIIFFDAHSWHRGTPATKHGWRFFIRATRNASYKPENEIRVNAMAYLPVVEAGW